MKAAPRQLAFELGLESRVRFLGFEPDLRRWMQAADAFVLSSRWEGLPMGLLEAGACALPAVATDVPGTREVIVPAKPAHWPSSGQRHGSRRCDDPPDAHSPEERRAMGQRARQRVLERFSLERCLDRWEALYNGILQRNPSVHKRWGSDLA